MNVQEEYRWHRPTKAFPRYGSCPTWAAHYPDEIDHIVGGDFTPQNGWNGPCTKKAECGGASSQLRR
jgi:hypothetical protein